MNLCKQQETEQQITVLFMIIKPIARANYNYN